MGVDAQVAARILTLEAEHKVELSLLQTELREEIELLKIENRNLQEKLQHETHLKEDLESVSSDPWQGRALRAQGGPADTPSCVWCGRRNGCFPQLPGEGNASGFARLFIMVWNTRTEWTVSASSKLQTGLQWQPVQFQERELVVPCLCCLCVS